MSSSVMALSPSALCFACEDIFSIAYDLRRSEPLPINHTKHTFIASVEDGCRLCKIICHALYGWIYVRARERTIRDLGIIDIPDDFQLRCSFSAAFRNPEERNERSIRILSDEVRQGSATQIHHALQQYSLSLRMQIWNDAASDTQVSVVIHPLLRWFILCNTCDGQG